MDINHNSHYMMNTTVEKIYHSREDLSEYVFHFTRGAHGRDTLEKILSEGVIKDISSKGYICFTEAPILLLPDMFDIFNRYPEPMYSPYGIGIKRDTLYRIGGRPVIYGTETDKAQIQDSLHWRFVMMKPDEYDFSWLREWRLPEKEYSITGDDIVIVKTIGEEQEILLDFDDVDVEGEPADGGFQIFYTGIFIRKHKGVSIERIRNTEIDKKEKLKKDFSEQGAIERIHLGFHWE